MHKQSHIWYYLAIYSLGILMLLNIGFTNNYVNASQFRIKITKKITRNNFNTSKNAFHKHNIYRINNQRIAHQKRLQQLKHRIQRHQNNVQHYRDVKHQHQINRQHLTQQERKRKVRQNKVQYNKDVIRNRNYGFYNNYKLDIDTVKPRNSYYEIMGNDKVRFSHPFYLNYIHYVHNNHHYRYGDPQSIAILPNGDLYVLFNVGHKDSCINQIFKYNVKNHKLIKIGQDFKGGHGQGLSYDYKTHQLWMCVNRYRYKGYPRGILPKVLTITKVNQKSLKPYGRHFNFHSNGHLGEDFTYDNTGDYWNVSRSYRKHNRTAPLNSLQIYKGQSGKLRLIRDFLHSPSACIQNLAYNPLNNRLYVVGNGVIMSFPINHIQHLTNRDIKVAIMNHHSEFEDISFWNNRAYLLVHPNRILISTKSF